MNPKASFLAGSILILFCISQASLASGSDMISRLLKLQQDTSTQRALVWQDYMKALEKPDDYNEDSASKIPYLDLQLELSKEKSELDKRASVISRALQIVQDAQARSENPQAALVEEALRVKQALESANQESLTERNAAMAKWKQFDQANMESDALELKLSHAFLESDPARAKSDAQSQLAQDAKVITLVPVEVDQLARARDQVRARIDRLTLESTVLQSVVSPQIAAATQPSASAIAMQPAPQSSAQTPSKPLSFIIQDKNDELFVQARRFAQEQAQVMAELGPIHLDPAKQARVEELQDRLERINQDKFDAISAIDALNRVSPPVDPSVLQASVRRALEQVSQRLNAINRERDQLIGRQSSLTQLEKERYGFLTAEAGRLHAAVGNAAQVITDLGQALSAPAAEGVEGRRLGDLLDHARKLRQERMRLLLDPQGLTTDANQKLMTLESELTGLEKSIEGISEAVADRYPQIHEKVFPEATQADVVSRLREIYDEMKKFLALSDQSRDSFDKKAVAAHFRRLREEVEFLHSKLIPDSPAAVETADGWEPSEIYFGPIVRDEENAKAESKLLELYEQIHTSPFGSLVPTFVPPMDDVETAGAGGAQ